MTNQPDESHPLRDRVDEAISWFTATNGPPEPVAEEGRPVDAETASAQESAPVTEPVTDVAPDAPAHIAADAGDAPVASRLPGNEAASVEVANEAPVAEPAVAGHAVAEPAVAAHAVAEPVTGAPAVDEREVAPERVYEADEFTPPPAAGPAEPEEPQPTDVAPERVSEADDFVLAHEPPPSEAEAAPITAVPVAETSEAASDEEPTRIHPIESPSSWAEVHPEGRHAAVPEAETTAGQRSLFRDEAPTMAMSAAGAVAGAGAVPIMERTAVLDAQETARVRREERAARDRQLGKVIAAPEDSDRPLVTPVKPPTTYKGLPSFGFLVFRLIIATVVGIRAWQHVTHLSATRDMWAATVVPSPGIVAWTQIGAEAAIVVMLVLGLGTRIAGLALLVLSMAQLVFVQWGVVSPFQPGTADFIGAVDVLLAGAGLLLATVGGGRAAFDGAIHTGRLRRKNDKLFT